MIAEFIGLRVREWGSNRGRVRKEKKRINSILAERMKSLAQRRNRGRANSRSPKGKGGGEGADRVEQLVEIFSTGTIFVCSKGLRNKQYITYSSG